MDNAHASEAYGGNAAGLGRDSFASVGDFSAGHSERGEGTNGRRITMVDSG